MKRYLAFVYKEYYPEGGMKDSIGVFDTLDEAVTAIKKYVESRLTYDTIEEEWEKGGWTASVYDIQNLESIWECYATVPSNNSQI